MQPLTRHRRKRPLAVLALAAAAVASMTVAAVPTGASSAPATPGPYGEIVLPTGEHVDVVAARGGPRVVLPPGGHGPGVRVLRLAGHTYVVPVEAEASTLDLSLFDLAQLARHQDRIPVSLRLTGTSVPGVTITSRSGDTATGYVTPTSAPRLGATLRAERGRIPGLRRMSLDVPAPAAVTPKYQQYTVDVTVKPPTGVTPDVNRLIVINVDDSRKFSTGYQFAGGDQRISVPAGHYVLMNQAVSAPATDSDPYRSWMAFTDLTVTGNGQVAVIDSALATGTPYASFDVPRAATEQSAAFDYGVTDDLGRLALNLGGTRQSNVRDYVQSVQGGGHGTLSSVEWAQLTGPSSATTPYGYYLSVGHENAVVADEHVTLSPSDLATVQARYYGDGRTLQGTGGNSPQYPYLTPGWISLVDMPAAPVTRTEYLYNSPGAAWVKDTTQYAPDNSSAIGETTQPLTYQAGRTYREDYFRGPHAPGAFSQPGNGWPYCQACRTAATMQLGIATFTDSDPDHYGGAFGSADGADQHMLVRQDGTVIADQDYAVYGRAEPFDIATGEHDYQVVGTYDGAIDGQVLSAHATTEWDFRTTDSDPAVPDGWQCAAEASTPCDVLPMMAVHYALPTGMTGAMRPGTSSFVVTVGHLRGATRTPITGLSFGIAVDGGASVAQRVQALGGGCFRVTIDNPAVAAGTGMTVTLHATDAAGGSISQTVQTAYTISGS